MKLAKTALGAVPIRVVIPPIVAAYAIPSIRAVEKPLFSISEFWLEAIDATETPIGNNIRVVDVFIIHIDKNALTPIKPAINVDPSFPENLNIPNAIRSWRLALWILNAIINPPKNKKIFLFEKGIAASENDEIPNSGKNIRGRSAVINKGIASVAQRIAIKDPTAATRHALIEIPSGWGLRSINRKIVIAKQSLILILFIRFITKFIS